MNKQLIFQPPAAKFFLTNLIFRNLSNILITILMMLGAKSIFPQLIPRIASLLCNFRNPANTSNPAYLQANLLLVGVWRVKPPDSNLYVNIHCYLLLTLASYFLHYALMLMSLSISSASVSNVISSASILPSITSGFLANLC